MPAASDPTAGTPPLPLRLRPLGVRIAAVAFGLALLVTVVAVWLTLPAAAQEGFTILQRITVAAMVLGVLAVGHALGRCRVDADEGGLTVVNGYRTHRLAWQQVVAVSLRPGSPWAVLDLSDGTTRAALGIQGSDGARAVRQARQLRALVEARSAADPRD
jgi:Bacterial PH domain